LVIGEDDDDIGPLGGEDWSQARKKEQRGKGKGSFHEAKETR
jgi:hypothetical protein